MHLPFEQMLQGKIEGCLHLVAGWGFGQDAIGEVRREKGQVAVARRHAEPEQARIAGGRPAREQAPAEGLAHARELGRPGAGTQGLQALVRVLWQEGEGERLGQRQAIRRLAEVDQAGRADALDVAAVGDQVQVGFEDLVLAVAGLQPQCREDLLQLAGDVAGVDVVQAARELHGQRRAAHAPAARKDRAERAAQGKRIDAGVKAEPAIFIEQRGSHRHRRDGRQGRPQADLLVVGEGHAQKLATPCVHRARKGNAGRKRRVRSKSQERKQ